MPTFDPFPEIFRRAADELRQLLPSDILAECDRLLGEGATARQRWAKYDCTLTNLQHTKMQEQHDDHCHNYLPGPAA